MIYLYIVHENDAVRNEQIHVLQGELDLQVIGSASNVEAAQTVLADARCDIVLASFTLPDDGALGLVQTLCAATNSTKVLITGMANVEEAVLNCIEEGAAGYVFAHESWADLVKKVRAVHENEFMVCPGIATAVMARISELKQLILELDGGNWTKPEDVCAVLTQREWEVLQLIGEDKSNQEIAEALTIEPGTVKNHVHNLLRKLDVTNRKHAARLARQISNTDTVPIGASS